MIDNVPFSSAAESRRESLDIYWDIIRELSLSNQKGLTTYSHAIPSFSGYEMNQSLPGVFGSMAGTSVRDLAELVAFNKAHEKLAFAKGMKTSNHQGQGTY